MEETNKFSNWKKGQKDLLPCGCGTVHTNDVLTSYVIICENHWLEEAK